MTLAGLAESADLSIGLLSRLENGMGNPSLGTLTKLAGALDVPVVALFSRPPAAAAVKVPADSRIAVIPVPGVRHELLVPSVNGRFLVSLLELALDAPSPCPAGQHSGVEFISVLHGRVDLHVGDERHRLEVGDSATYDPTRPHHIERAGRGVARLLYATTPASIP
jgi:transcriptional regulator with XRE-family HTH domain